MKKNLQFSPFTGNVFEKGDYKPVGKENLPPVKYQYGELPNPGPVPVVQNKFLSPRYEPSNITQNATVMQVQQAIRDAENGQTFDLFRFYRDVLLNDDHIQSEINTRKLAMLALPLAIMPAQKDNPDDVLVAKALTQAKEDCENWNDGMLALLDSTSMFPVSILERLYQPQPEKSRSRAGAIKLNYTFKKFVPVNHQLECYLWAYMMGGVGLGTASAIQLANLQGQPAGGNPLPAPRLDGQMLDADGNRPDPANPYTIDLERWEPYLKLWPIDAAGRPIYDVTRASYLDPERHIVHRGHLLTTFRDNWGGPGRALLMWWLFRGLGRQWFARDIERYGSPFPVAYTDINDPAQVQLLRDAFDLSRKIGGLVVSENSRVELKEAMVQGMAQGYDTFYKLCNDAISKIITGKDSSSKPAGLNAGEGQYQENVRGDYCMFDQMRANDTLQRQLADPFCEVNGLPGGKVRFVWGGLSDSDASTFATMLNTMKQAGYQLADESMATANERTGLTWEKVTQAEPADGAPGKPAKAGTTNKEDDEDDEKIKTMGALIRLSAHDGRTALLDPMDEVVLKRKGELAKAYRNAMAPFREAILKSNSKEEALKLLSATYPDWADSRLVEELNTALQICAASGATQNK